MSGEIPYHLIRSCTEGWYGLGEEKLPKHNPTQKCLYFNGAWRNVCLACGMVEIDGEWKRGYEL